MKNAMFLRAERGAEGKRTFKLVEGEPLETSYGQDSYIKIFSGEESSPNESTTGFDKSLHEADLGHQGAMCKR